MNAMVPVSPRLDNWVWVGLVGLLLLCVAGAAARASSGSPDAASRALFPRPARPIAFDVVDISCSAPGEYLLMQSIQGLLAKSRPQVYLTRNGPDDSTTLSLLEGEGIGVGEAQAVADSIGPLVSRIPDCGYILIDYSANPHSLNTGFSLAGVLNAVVVDASVMDEARSCGLLDLPLRADLRGKEWTERRVFDQYRSLFNRKALFELSVTDDWRFDMRDWVVANNGFVFWDDEAGILDADIREYLPTSIRSSVASSKKLGAFRREILQWAEPNSPVFGWGESELNMAGQASLYGKYVVATAWIRNLSAIAGVDIPAESKHVPKSYSLRQVAWEDDVHYVTFQESDGDNPGWVMGPTFQANPAFWAASTRGQYPYGWGISAMNHDLTPLALRAIYQTATPNDNFVISSSGGYMFPGLYGAKLGDGGRALEEHTKALERICREAGLPVAVLISPQMQADFGAYARNIPGLLGLIFLQFAPDYAAQRGKVEWVADGRGSSIPVISAKMSMWTGINDWKTVAASVGKMTHQGAPEKSSFYSVISVHAWSQTLDSDVASAVDELRAKAPWVRIVSPEALIMTMRLRARPAETLAPYARWLGETAQRLGDTAGAASVAQGETLLVSGRYREAFEALKKADADMEQRRLSCLSATWEATAGKLCLSVPELSSMMFMASASTRYEYEARVVSSDEWDIADADGVREAMEQGGEARARSVGPFGDMSDWVSVSKI